MKIIFLLLSLISFVQAASPINGSEKSFKNAFEALLKTDGAGSEEWDIEIGKLIKTHPTNFLKVLNLYSAKIKRLDALVGNFGYELVDKFEEQKAEASSRIKALEKAKTRSSDHKIKALADDCIKLLKKF